MTQQNDLPQEGIAIVGMAGRFPGARDVATFWENIKAGRESITHFDLSELEVELPQGPDAPPVEDYVCAKGMLDDVDMFDARFFGYLPKEAEVMDPQHRLFLEICHEALEHAGHDPARYEGAVGVFGGCYMDTYILANLCADDQFRRALVESIQVGTLQTELGNDKDYLATRVAFKLGLRGPAMTLQTACSTSLVSIVTACQSLDAYQSDMALAGGVTIVLPQHKGYFFKEGSILAPDGHCRTFDANAAGTVFSNGAAVLLLKRLADAIADRDTIYGVIKGYASNNDGGTKVSYTAPSVEGQAEVISLALGLGDIDARTIGYVEAHGTATPIGDPIEIGGLTTAYRQFTEDTQYCAIGSVKANLGHLDIASGAIGTIKTALALHHKTLPPQINYEKPNPKIDFAASPFYVNTELREWAASEYPRRAGVSSFGVGGTNAHIVLEEAPEEQARDEAVGPYLLPLSAKSEAALEAQAVQLADHLEQYDGQRLDDVAFTMQMGRQQFAHRRVVGGASRDALVAGLRSAPGAMSMGKVAAAEPPLIFLFPGQGAQYPGMGRALYEAEPVYRAVIDEVSEVLLAEADFGVDLRDWLLWSPDTSDQPAEQISARLAETWLTQPAVFAVEMALARLLAAKGVMPTAMIGHSVGEFAAACLAGVFPLEEAARLVAARGQLMWKMPRGKMLAVMLPADQVENALPPGVSIAAVNAPGATVVSGSQEAIDAYAATLTTKDIKSTELATSHGFHSSMMEGARAPLVEKVASTHGSAAQAEIISTLTGAALAPETLCDGAYWGEQLMQPVKFLDAVREAARLYPQAVFVEVGPGQALTSFVRQGLSGEAKRPVIPALGPVRDPGCDVEAVMSLIGALWVNGASPDWSALHGTQTRRVALPTYPFERKRFWVDPPAEGEGAVSAPVVNTVTTAAADPAIDEVERLIHQQIQLVSQQLKAMQGK